MAFGHVQHAQMPLFKLNRCKVTKPSIISFDNSIFNLETPMSSIRDLLENIGPIEQAPHHSDLIVPIQPP
jgi:hypothetical protein